MSDNSSQQQSIQQHDSCMRKFIALANEMKESGLEPSLVNWALMTASGIYATYSVAGNEGGLTESGIERVTAAYKKNLEQIQTAKKNQFGQEASNSAGAPEGS